MLKQVMVLAIRSLVFASLLSSKIRLNSMDSWIRSNAWERACKMVLLVRLTNLTVLPEHAESELKSGLTLLHIKMQLNFILI